MNRQRDLELLLGSLPDPEVRAEIAKIHLASRGQVLDPAVGGRPYRALRLM